MKKSLLISLLYIMFTIPVVATATDDEQALLATVNVLKSIVNNSLTEQQAKSELSRLPHTKPFIKDGHYMGHKLFENKKLTGLLKVSYQNNVPVLAAYSTVPLKVRHATKMYKTWREILSKHYKEASHNRFDLGDGIVAQLSKNQRALTIFVSQEK